MGLGTKSTTPLALILTPNPNLSTKHTDKHDEKSSELSRRLRNIQWHRFHSRCERRKVLDPSLNGLNHNASKSRLFCVTFDTLYKTNMLPFLNDDPINCVKAGESHSKDMGICEPHWISRCIFNILFGATRSADGQWIPLHSFVCCITNRTVSVFHL
jgi:hypothetical protein